MGDKQDAKFFGHYYLHGDDTLEKSLVKHGFSKEDITDVFLSHLHFDHCGQNAAFPGVPIFVQQSEWDVAWDEGYTITEWLDFEGARYERVRGDVEIAPGIRLLATPGHTPGHQSVSVETDEGLVLIVGQAAQDAREFATKQPDASLGRLRDLNAAFVHFSHDRAVLKRTPRDRGAN